MLIVHAAGATGTSWAYLDTTLHESSLCKISHVNPFLNCASSPGYSNALPVKLHSSSLSWKRCGLPKTFDLSHQVASKKWLCCLHDSSSPDDEYRSSRNIAISLLRRYKNFVDRGGGDNLKVYPILYMICYSVNSSCRNLHLLEQCGLLDNQEFISAGVNAYALGCTNDGLRKELNDMRESDVEIEGMQNYDGNVSLKSKIFSEEVDECILWLSIVFITILCTPQPTIVRWSSTAPVSDEILLEWKGFCALIANAYYTRGMAWLPVKTLQLEQMAVVGHAEEPSVVASRMQLVFSTLEVVSPQWPRV